MQCDETWAFVYAKQKNVPEEMKGTFGVGDVWTWTAMDADTKQISRGRWAVAMPSRPTRSCSMWLDRLATRVQLTTDGHKPYLEAVEGAFGNAIDYAMLVKTYEGVLARALRPSSATAQRSARAPGT